MNKKKVNAEEISALLEAFSNVQKNRLSEFNQSPILKLAVTLINIYVISSIFMYLLLREGVLDQINPVLLNEDFLTLFNGRAYAMFWVLAAMNISLYFNIAFFTVALCSLIYVLNGTAEYFLVFGGGFSFSEAPYFSVFILSLPLFIVVMLIAVFTYKMDPENA
tara:strand:+ start:444 stop:935 length:492 start_codon:yes stop_codon:yes gene_type:complete